MHDFSLAFLYLSSTPWNTWITTLLNFKSHKWSIIPSSYITTLFLTILLLTSLSLSLSLGTKLLMEKSPNSTEEEEALTKKLHELLDEPDNEETEKFNSEEENVEEKTHVSFFLLLFFKGFFCWTVQNPNLRKRNKNVLQ